jgi:hypothetical protein
VLFPVFFFELIVRITLYLPNSKINQTKNKQMRVFTLITAILFAVQTYAQDVKGYYIMDSGKKVEGFFKYGNFFDTQSLKFKETKDSDFAALPQGISEYGAVEDSIKFEKHIVDIDISGNNSYKKNPEWLKQTVFLNVVIKGNATLYSYSQNNKTIFFFSTLARQGAINQLVSRKYKLSDDTIVESATFRQQLYNEAICEGQKVSDFARIKYDEKQLSEVIKKYNECTGSKFEVYGAKKTSDFKYSVFAGVHSLNVGIDNAFPAVDNQSSVTFSAGAEASYIFPSGKWALFVRGEFESLNSELVDSHDQGFNVMESTYKIEGGAFNFMFGPRYNFLVSSKSSIFLDAGLCLSQPFADIKKSVIIYPLNNGTPYEGEKQNYDFKTGFAMNLGVGYSFNKKYCIALRYMTNRDFLEDVYSNYKTKISRIGLMVSYTLN